MFRKFQRACLVVCLFAVACTDQGSPQSSAMSDPSVMSRYAERLGIESIETALSYAGDFPLIAIRQDPRRYSDTIVIVPAFLSVMPDPQPVVWEEDTQNVDGDMARGVLHQTREEAFWPGGVNGILVLPDGVKIREQCDSKFVITMGVIDVLIEEPTDLRHDAIPYHFRVLDIRHVDGVPGVFEDSKITRTHPPETFSDMPSCLEN